ncbi:MAG: two-component hybrid sensor and regulator [Candidatus Jettenia ecosi]|uniref:Two-component hybrid sensor and regulator n=1 Tax=Candidatus Jettenia ecosi TaxID=2494326 RepID=A0A533QDU5_9BACT|nr:MAG: two-component hybrid sensor and regulator [Candidatus Jettenia ecosi]
MTGRKKKIILAEDNLAIVDALTIMLEEFGYEVIPIVDGNTVKDKLKEKPDLVLFDLWMQGWNGRDACRHLKSNEDTKDIPVIIISADRDIAQLAKEAGADDFIAKPFQIEDLLAKVEKYIGKNEENSS